MALAVLALAPAFAAPALDPATGFIMAPDHARDLLHQCSRNTPQGVTGTWQPAAAQIADLETRLPSAVVQAQPDVRGGYGRQYADYVINGQKLIYVNAFPRGVLGDDFGKDPAVWNKATHQAVTVCDGGHDFFGVLYDPETKTFSHFAFNGFA
ncbi:MAG: hypothetical protein ISS15_19565 [Alphaproteobacteria bacterium]|nr:hypothetical protein [Alphaproteobacteria bacterium]MBL6939944.1 hypothetical protein [Alphaproteobacteria bacterium]MBL7099862.1 hypothetical protein [Alphaproteobacteria bacterium]